MATSSGAVQNHARIEWVNSIGSISASTTAVTVSVQAYFRMYDAGYNQIYNGTKSRSGWWGSASGAQTYNLASPSRVQLYSVSQSVTLTDSSQSISVTASAQHFFGTTSSTWNFSVGPRYARTPTTVLVDRTSDTSHVVHWNRLSVYTSVVVQRQTDGGAWVEIGRASGNAASYTDTKTAIGHRYRYRVAGIGGAGQSAFSTPSAYIYTTPNPPSGVTAKKVGSNIEVNASNLTPYATFFDVYDGTELVGSVIPRASLPFVHLSPNSAVTHTYRMVARLWSETTNRITLYSAKSAASNTVQLLAPPLAPTGLTPNGPTYGAGSASTLTLRWTHNPVDTTDQTAAEVQWREQGTSSWTTVTATTSESRSITMPPPGDYEWRVRTKGEHPDFSPYSTISRWSVISAPTVAITSPDAVIAEAQVTATWSYSQDEGVLQERYRARLYRGSTLLREISGQGRATSASFPTLLSNNTDYRIEVTVWADGVASETAEQPFRVRFIPPAPPILTGLWNEVNGSHDIAVSDGTEGTFLAITNRYVNPSFEAESALPSRTSRTSEWSQEGDFSLYCPPPGLGYPSLANFPSTNNFPITGEG